MSTSNNDNSLLSMDMLLSEEDDKQQDEAMLNIINDDSSILSNSVKAVKQPKPLIQTFSIEDLEASPIRVAGVTASQQVEFEDDYK